ncbi:hypothetical protein FA95DRAFT_1506490 [Auriscalpium vulgare]|uniref:Uncharacterized protein n=1 Tax=Auriscalpium vulgare TaxID=40419 RepID=A0ACB8R209_9AGAM|nr:hypothetical protein FA95DRAFT_1506490 [Auriscalpium vulgare]
MVYLKMAAVRLRQRGLDTVSDIRDITHMSRASLYRTWRLYSLTGSVSKKQPVSRGRPRHLIYHDIQYLLSLARHSPATFLDEYCDRLARNRLFHTSLATVHRAFVRAGLNLKQLQKLASERSPVKRADYIRRIGQYSPASLVFLDEVSKDERTYARLWGRAPKGQPVEGSFTKDLFLAYLRDDLVRCNELLESQS